MAATFDEIIATSGLERSEARLLTGHVAGRSKTWLMAHGDEQPDEALAGRISEQLQRRRAGEPVAYLLGEKEFYSYVFQVGPGVLIPRPETEMLVQWGLEFLLAKDGPSSSQVLDLGCGSGCIGLSLALEAQRLDLALERLTQSDIAEAALQFTARNAEALGVTKLPGLHYELARGSWFEALPAGRCFDVILSNPPYIRSADEHLLQGDLRFEPAHALASGDSGLDAIETITAGAARFLKAGGLLAIEHGFDQAGAVSEALGRHGFSGIATRRDLAGHPRVSGGIKP